MSVKTNERQATGAPHPLMTVAEAAQSLRLSPETVRRMVHGQRLAGIVLGAGDQAAIRIPRALIDQMLAKAAAGMTVVASEYSADFVAADVLENEAA